MLATEIVLGETPARTSALERKMAHDDERDVKGRRFSEFSLFIQTFVLIRQIGWLHELG